MAGNNSLGDNYHFQKIFEPLIEHCSEEVLSKPYPDDGKVYCNATMDSWAGCWNFTLAGTDAVINCPAIPGLDTNEIATKFCTDTGDWWTDDSGRGYANYTACFGKRDRKEFPEDSYTHLYMFIGGYAVSFVLLVISLFIFFRFRQLRCDRITIHKNLFISYTFTGLMWSIYYILVAMDGDVLYHNPKWCQALHVIPQYFMVCNFAWMFCEGLYLHTIMVKAFSSGKWLLIACYIVGWYVPSILTGIYAGLRATDPIQNTKCWIDESSLQWIMYAPIVFSMIMNVIFLCNIVRLLITKLRQIPEASQTKKAARATLILIPLLGLQFLILPLRPDHDSPLTDAYHYVAALVVSLQGAFVSLMYCFFNSEIISLLKRKWYQHRVMAGEKRTTSTMATGSYALVDTNSAYHTTVT